MSAKLRQLTSTGIERFRSFLAQLRKDRTLSLPFELLIDPETSEAVPQEIQLERPGFKVKSDAASYLKDRLAPLHSPAIATNAGLWTWLTLFYFDDVCPAVDGSRKPVADAHYILDPFNHRRRYRHLLATPYRILITIPDHNRIFLNTPLPVHGDLIEQTMGRLYLIRIPAVREAIDMLYFDEATGRVKRGAMNKTPRRGDLRSRFVTRIQQLSLTYDVGSLNGAELISLMGAEFERWRINGDTTGAVPDVT